MRSKWFLSCASALVCGLTAYSIPSGQTESKAEMATSPNVIVHVNIPKQTLQTQAQVATSVVHGRVLATETFKAMKGLLATRIHLDVIETLKGDHRPRRAVAVVGGSDASGNTHVKGAPSISKGDEVVLFLWGNGKTAEDGILGLSQGAVRITESESSRVAVGGLARASESAAAFLARVRQIISNHEEREAR